MNIVIFGHARSGTTFLADALNLQSNIYIMKEAEIYFHKNIDNFSVFFNKKSELQKKPFVKGNFIPPFSYDNINSSEILNHLGKDFLHVGDKVAFGPRRPEQELFFEWINTDLKDALLIATFREPISAFFSMKKMFREISINDIVGVWIQSLHLMLVLSSFRQHFVAIPLDRFRRDVLELLFDKIGIDGNSAFRQLRSYAALSPSDVIIDGGLLEKCISLYEKIDQLYDDNNLRFRGYTESDTMLADTIQFAEEILASIGHPTLCGPRRRQRTSATDPRRPLVEYYANQVEPPQEAVDIAESYVADYPNDASAHYHIGMIKLHRGCNEPHSILAHFDRAMTLGFSPLWVYFHRSQAHIKYGDKKSAISDLKLLLELDSENKIARNLVADLEAGQLQRPFDGGL